MGSTEKFEAAVRAYAEALWRDPEAFVTDYAAWAERWSPEQVDAIVPFIIRATEAARRDRQRRCDEAVADEVIPRCDVCNVADEEAEDWCGVCGCCREHCQQYEGCDE